MKGANVDFKTPQDGNPAFLSGSIGKRLLNNGMDPNVLRPYLGDDGRAYITQYVNGKRVAIPVPMLNASLRVREWEQMDEVLLKTAQTPC